MQRVKPTAGLVDRFGNEIRRKSVLKGFLILKGVMPLSERHGTGVEPYVGQLRNAAHFTAARTFERHFIDVGAVQVQQFCAFSAQLLDAADGPLCFAPLAHPNRQRRSPIAIA